MDEIVERKWRLESKTPLDSPLIIQKPTDESKALKQVPLVFTVKRAA
jgi:hypothetical protein